MKVLLGQIMKGFLNAENVVSWQFANRYIVYQYSRLNGSVRSWDGLREVNDDHIKVKLAQSWSARGGTSYEKVGKNLCCLLSTQLGDLDASSRQTT